MSQLNIRLFSRLVSGLFLGLVGCVLFNAMPAQATFTNGESLIFIPKGSTGSTWAFFQKGTTPLSYNNIWSPAPVPSSLDIDASDNYKAVCSLPLPQYGSLTTVECMNFGRGSANQWHSLPAVTGGSIETLALGEKSAARTNLTVLLDTGEVQEWNNNQQRWAAAPMSIPAGYINGAIDAHDGIYCVSQQSADAHNPGSYIITLTCRTVGQVNAAPLVEWTHSSTQITTPPAVIISQTHVCTHQKDATGVMAPYCWERAGWNPITPPPAIDITTAVAYNAEIAWARKDLITTQQGQYTQWKTVKWNPSAHLVHDSEITEGNSASTQLLPGWNATGELYEITLHPQFGPGTPTVVFP